MAADEAPGDATKLHECPKRKARGRPRRQGPWEPLLQSCPGRGPCHTSPFRAACVSASLVLAISYLVSPNLPRPSHQMQAPGHHVTRNRFSVFCQPDEAPQALGSESSSPGEALAVPTPGRPGTGPWAESEPAAGARSCAPAPALRRSASASWCRRRPGLHPVS